MSKTKNLIARINRKLAPGEKLCTLRGERWLSDLGRYFIVDTHQGNVQAAHVDLEETARELGII